MIKKHVFSSVSLKPDLGINASCIKLANYLTNMSQQLSTCSTPHSLSGSINSFYFQSHPWPQEIFLRPSSTPITTPR